MEWWEWSKRKNNAQVVHITLSNWTLNKDNNTIHLHLIIVIHSVNLFANGSNWKGAKNSQLFSVCNTFDFGISIFSLTETKGNKGISLFLLLPRELIYSQLIPFAIARFSKQKEVSGIYHKSYHRIVTYHASVAPPCIVPIDFAGAILRHWNVHRSKRIAHYPKRK